MKLLLVLALANSMVADISEADVERLEREADASRQSLQKITTMERHTTVANAFLRTAVPALERWHVSSKTDLAELLETARRGAQAVSPEVVHQTIADVSRLAQAIEQGLEGRAADLSSECQLPAELDPSHTSERMQAMLRSVSTACEEAQKSSGFLLGQSRMILASAEALVNTPFPATDGVGDSPVAAPEQSSSWRFILLQRHQFLQNEGHAPLLAARVRSSLSQWGYGASESGENARDQSTSLETASTREEDILATSRQRSAIAERSLDEPEQNPRCARLAGQLLVPEPTVAHERLFLQFLACQESL